MLLKGGTVIDTFPEVVVRRDTDVLIDDGRIAAVGPGLTADAEVIDARERIVLPGFVDTHRHLWQTALRGLTLDEGLGVYFERVLSGYGSRFRAEDVAAGTLAGALECLDAGITTVQDYSHVQRSPDQADAALDALEHSGIRAVFGFGPSPLGGAAVDAGEMRRIMARRSDRLGLAVAAIGPAYAPFETVRADWELADSLGVPVVVHVSSTPQTPDPITRLRDAGLARPNTLYVHGNNLPDSELKVIAETGAAVSVTPTVESRMQMGPQLSARLREAGIPFSLGIDVVTTAGGDMFRAMHEVLSLGYQTFTAADVLQLATYGGAQALGLPDVGSLAIGNQADVILLRTTDINLSGGTHDPIATVVTAAHPGNIDTVLVAGTPAKHNGHLLNPLLPTALTALADSTTYLTT